MLPACLADYGYEPGGYKGNEALVPPYDAEWFLRALDGGIVELQPRARLKLPASHLKAAIFWEHSRSVSPRLIGLQLESVTRSCR